MVTFTWIGNVNDFWDNDYAWLGTIAPGLNPDDDVYINVAGNITTTHRFGNTVIRNLTTNENFVIKDGTLEVNGEAYINGDFILGHTYSNGNPFLVANGIVNFNDDSLLIDGGLDGDGEFNNHGTLTIASYVDLKTTLNNHNTTILDGGNLYFYGGNFNNLAGATFQMEGYGLWERFSPDKSAFNNFSVFNKTKTTKATVDVEFNNYTGAEVNVLQGELRLEEGGANIDTIYRVADGARLYVGRSVNESGDKPIYRLRNTSFEVEGNGELIVDSVLFAEKNPVTFAGNTELSTFSDLQGAGFNNTGTVRIFGDGGRLKTTLRNELNGVIQQDSPNFELDGGRIENLGGVYQVSGLYLGSKFLKKSGSGGTFINDEGIIRKVGDGFAEIDVHLIDTLGRVESQRGYLYFTGTELDGTRLITAPDTAAITLDRGLDAGNHVVKNIDLSQNEGSVRFRGNTKIEGSPLNLYGDTQWWAYISSTQFTGENLINHGDLSIRTTPGSRLTPEHHLATAMINRGEINHWADDNTITFLENGALINEKGATYNFFTDPDGFGDIKSQGSNNYIDNYGLFRKSGDRIGYISVDIHNFGEWRVDEGALRLDSDFIQTDGKLFLNHTELYTSKAFQINGGSLEGEGLINGMVEIGSADIKIGTDGDGDTGILNIQGNWDETDLSTLSFDINGDLAGEDFDLLKIDGTFFGDGTINIRLTDEFQPQIKAGDRFKIIEYDAYALNPDGVNFTGLEISNELSFAVQWNPDNLTLAVV